MASVSAGATATALLKWPDQRFGDEPLLCAERGADRLLAHARARCGRPLPDAPAGVPMPHPIP